MTHTPTTSRRRLLLFRCITACVLPLLLLGLLELMLTVFNVGHPTSFLLQDTVGGQPVYRENNTFSWQFFPTPEQAREAWPVVVPQETDSRTYRVLVVGGSAAQGTPAPSFGVCRMLHRMLQREMPDRTVQVLNGAIVAVNSHVARVVVEDAVPRLKPDALVIYSGNNEVVGPYGPGTVFQALTGNLFYTRLSIFVNRTRTGQLIGKFLSALKDDSRQKNWGGMAMFLDRKVSADSPAMQRVYASFRGNLDAMIQTARKAGTKVVLCTIPVNLLDCAPFASGIPDDKDGFDQLMARGITSYSLGRQEEAAALFDDIVARYPQHATGWYLSGRTLLALGRKGDALERFQAACDLDQLRFRADSTINRTVRETAAAAGIPLADLEAAFFEQSAKGIPGRDLLYEHVHLNPRGNYFAAACITEALLGPNAAWTPPEYDTVIKDLGYTAWHHADVQQKLLRFMDKPPFTGQWNHQYDMDFLANEFQIALGYKNRIPDDELVQLCLEAISRHQGDWVLHHILARMLNEMGQLALAEKHARFAVSLVPHSIPVRFLLIKILMEQQREDEALEQLAHTGETFSGPDAMLDALAQSLASSSPGAAISIYSANLARFGQTAKRLFSLGKLVLAAGRPAEASVLFQNCLRVQPGHADALTELGIMEAEREQFAAADDYFAEALRSNPNHMQAQFNRAAVLDLQGKPAEALALFKQTLEQHPHDLNLIESVIGLLFRLDQAGDIPALLERGFMLYADWTAGHRYAVQLLKDTEQHDRMLFHLLEWARIDSGNPDPLRQAAMLKMKEEASVHDLEDALRLLNSCSLRSDTTQAADLELLSWVHERLGMNREAVRNIEQLQGLIPPDHPIQTSLSKRLLNLRERARSE